MIKNVNIEQEMKNKISFKIKKSQLNKYKQISYLRVINKNCKSIENFIFICAIYVYVCVYKFTYKYTYTCIYMIIYDNTILWNAYIHVYISHIYDHIKYIILW